jgi:biofilm PGA synthesis N-glycosyltransferase PgaC
LLHPSNGFVAFALWSHKIIRWLVPFILCAEYILCTMLAFDSTLLSVAFFIQSIALGLAVLGYAAEKMKIKIGIFGIPYYFLAMNAALFFGFIRFLTGTQPPTWDVAR